MKYLVSREQRCWSIQRHGAFWMSVVESIQLILSAKLRSVDTCHLKCRQLLHFMLVNRTKSLLRMKGA